MISRRSFLKNLVKTAGGILVASSVPQVLFEEKRKKYFFLSDFSQWEKRDKWGLTNRQKEAVIHQVLNSREGKVALSQSMVESIRRSLNYQAIGRKILMVDELPNGVLSRYERDVAAIAHVTSRRNKKWLVA